MSETIIIAEAGVNHNGSIKQAKKLIEVAADAGADYVKFQTFKAEDIASKHTDKAEYQKNKTDFSESHYEMLKKLELDHKMHLELIDFSDKKGIKFLSTPFDINSIDLLVGLGLDKLKIPSGEITNLPYLRHIACSRKPLIMSTGMAAMDEVRMAFEVLLNAGAEKDQITILHCNTEYPTPMSDVNLRAMLTIKNDLGVKVGYSDHTQGIEISIAAVALGAKVIEKHFTLNRMLPGPDHSASLEPDELKAMIDAIRNLEKALGDGVKKPSKSELKNISIVRKSIVAKRKIYKGELMNADNLSIKRPAIGLSPMEWDNIIGRSAPRDFDVDDIVDY
jgi:N,N'-diacetyllegionaminate synthase